MQGCSGTILRLCSGTNELHELAFAGAFVFEADFCQDFCQLHVLNWLAELRFVPFG